MYHHACWRKYVNHTHFKPDDAMHLQNVSLSEARNLFFRHVDSIIFTEREIRSLQSLLAEYKRIVGDYGYEVGDVKSSYVKGLLINEYQETIGFKERNQMNMSQWVYDVGGGGDYIEAAISSLGISDEQLLQNLAQRLSKKIKDTTTVPWPPHIDHLEEGEERTTTAINMGVNVHGMTRSKDLVETLHKSGVSISYADTLLLYDHWALMDLEASATCPQEIADSKPAIVIVDNDDFKIDTLTGNSTGAHRTNVMFVQPESYEKKPDEEPAVRLLKKKEIFAQLKQKRIELTNVHQYRCPPGSKSEPPARTRVDPPVNGTVLQRARCVIHALSRLDNNGIRPPPHE
ncbi:putative fatty-acid--CoA ligase fadD25 [Dissostichus eleginoides]|uniref:Fatty-acid--CoA ligase fadD25 n=1 Tax=Dissostichus eleginoides TaxID=100907 RepID=A0AAD9C233_DISEL|nr:putative fatty-acid--CoA ligase fadD25 [Dissostichus eleginoides]